MNPVFSLIFLVFGAISSEKTQDNNDGRTQVWDAGKKQREFVEAVWTGRLDVVKSLAKHVDLNRTDEDGCTPVWIAAYQRHKEIVEFLADKVDLNKANKYGRTPFWIAAWRGHMETVEFLADKVDLNRCSDYGHTPIWIAAKGGHTNIVKFLIEKNVKLEASLLTIRAREEIKRLIANAFYQK